jgi:hypothetical protein
MNISDAEKQAREWLKRIQVFEANREYARTILALLDRRVMPRPEDVPVPVQHAMQHAYDHCPAGRGLDAMMAAYRALYDAPTKREPVKVEDAAKALNEAVDAMWNNCKTPTPDHYVKAICAAQQELKRALEATHD